MSISTQPLPGTTSDPLYPDSDGEPMGETEFHSLACVHLYNVLRDWYRSRQSVHVAYNMLLYYEVGNPSAFRGPDLMVSMGVRGNHPRRSFRIWEEGVAPAVIIEVTSKKTWREDKLEKLPLYASLGVKEYFLFDPDGIHLQPPLQGISLVAGQCVPLEADQAGQIVSRELGLRLAVDEHLLRLIDPETGKPLPTDEEKEEARHRAERAERATKRKAKRDVDEAKREADEAKREAAEAKRKAQREVDEAQRRAEAERQRAAVLDAELARLRAALSLDQSYLY